MANVPNDADRPRITVNFLQGVSSKDLKSITNRLQTLLQSPLSAADILRQTLKVAGGVLEVQHSNPLRRLWITTSMCTAQVHADRKVTIVGRTHEEINTLTAYVAVEHGISWLNVCIHAMDMEYNVIDQISPSLVVTEAVHGGLSPGMLVKKLEGVETEPQFIYTYSLASALMQLAGLERNCPRSLQAIRHRHQDIIKYWNTPVVKREALDNDSRTKLITNAIIDVLENAVAISIRAAERDSWMGKPAIEKADVLVLVGKSSGVKDVFSRRAAAPVIWKW